MASSALTDAVMGWCSRARASSLPTRPCAAAASTRDRTAQRPTGSFVSEPAAAPRISRQRDRHRPEAAAASEETDGSSAILPAHASCPAIAPPPAGYRAQNAAPARAQHARGSPGSPLGARMLEEPSKALRCHQLGQGSGRHALHRDARGIANRPAVPPVKQPPCILLPPCLLRARSGRV
eukprot:361174-Chlamydomonas_euryale.AAC.2